MVSRKVVVYLNKILLFDTFDEEDEYSTYFTLLEIEKDIAYVRSSAELIGLVDSLGFSVISSPTEGKIYMIGGNQPYNKVLRMFEMSKKGLLNMHAKNFLRRQQRLELEVLRVNPTLVLTG